MNFDNRAVSFASTQASSYANGHQENSAAEWLSIDQLAQGSERLGGMVARSALTQAVFTAIHRLGPYKATVLIQGESGTGKELVARALHSYGPAPKGPYVTFNCSNLVDSLAESQLFGHVKGAFTDARDDSQGYFRSANGGTLFLDEIGELPLRLQAKLLRAVETYEVQPVGSSHSYHVDIRLIAATNRDLRAMVKAGQFRDDLYYRLNATSIVIPQLRRRTDDIDALTAHFVDHYNRLLSKRVQFISRRALNALMKHDWPGNVREFAHAIESAVLLTANDCIDVDSLPAELQSENAAAQHSTIELHSTQTAAENVEELDRDDKASPFSLDGVMKDTLLRSLEETAGNRRRAADLLGISRSTLYRMLSRYGVTDAGRRPAAYRSIARQIAK